jgi:SPX domain protein involved in polyphosphate accumulation
MKFGKEFMSQIVPEWQEVYMNYNSLKSILKEMLKFKEQNQSKAPVASTPKGSLKRRLTLYRAFSGLNGKQRGSSSTNEDEVILVRSEGSEDSKVLYQTMFLNPYEDGAERDLVFFRKLDVEFNKVNGFYKKMMKEVVEEAEELSKQINFLIALRIKVDKVVVGNLVNDAKHGKSFVMFLAF